MVSLSDTGHHQTTLSILCCRSRTNSMAVRVFPVPISINSAPTLDGSSFATASCWYGSNSDVQRQGRRSVVIIAQAVINIDLHGHFELRRRLAGLAPLRSPFRLQRRRHQRRFLGRTSLLYQFLCPGRQREIVSLGESHNLLPLFRRHHDVWAIPARARQRASGTVIVLVSGPFDGKPAIVLPRR